MRQRCSEAVSACALRAMGSFISLPQRYPSERCRKPPLLNAGAAVLCSASSA